MPGYTYKSRDRNGEMVEGTIDAPSLEVVQETIRERDLILLSVKKNVERQYLQKFTNITKGVKNKEIVIFARQLSVLISATVPIVRSLRILVKQTESKAFKDIINDIADEVDGGARLSAAMHRHGRVFDDFFVHMIRAGETTGRLDEVLTYLADQKEKDYQLVSRVISSMIYPAFIVLALVGIFIFMMIYVVPKLLEVVTSSGAELPVTTEILIGVSDFMQGYWWAIVIMIMIAVAAYTMLKSNPTGRRIIDEVKLRIPVIGKIFQKMYLARIGRSLANLLASGVPVTRSIEIVADIVGNQVYREIMLEVREDVEAGHSLSESLSRHDWIPPMMTQMMDVGEETGRLDQILTKVADFYIGEVNSLTDALASLVEPLILMLLGLGALVLVMGILMPIYSVTAQF